MPLIEPLPRHLRTALGLSESGEESLTIALAADLTLNGSFGEEWLAVTADRLKVFGAALPADGATAVPRLDLALADLAAARTWTTFFPILWFPIGTGTLIVWYVGGAQLVDRPERMSLGTHDELMERKGEFHRLVQMQMDLSRIQALGR
jgi:hypothetical protein